MINTTYLINKTNAVASQLAQILPNFELAESGVFLYFYTTT